MTTYYKATFSDGSVHTRSTDAGRTYTHAHACSWNSSKKSWASSEALAIKAGKGSEVVPAIEITSAEYRALKKGAA